MHNLSSNGNRSVTNSISIQSIYVAKQVQKESHVNVSKMTVMANKYSAATTCATEDYETSKLLVQDIASAYERKIPSDSLKI